jgi:hypothetical protein
MALVAERISDGRVLCLIGLFLKQDTMSETARWTPASGTPHGLSCRRCWRTCRCIRSIS